jgi:hypothetical protein
LQLLLSCLDTLGYFYNYRNIYILSVRFYCLIQWLFPKWYTLVSKRIYCFDFFFFNLLKLLHLYIICGRYLPSHYFIIKLPFNLITTHCSFLSWRWLNRGNLFIKIKVFLFFCIQLKCPFLIKLLSLSLPDYFLRWLGFNIRISIWTSGQLNRGCILIALILHLCLLVALSLWLSFHVILFSFEWLNWISQWKFLPIKLISKIR